MCVRVRELVRVCACVYVYVWYPLAFIAIKSIVRASSASIDVGTQLTNAAVPYLTVLDLSPNQVILRRRENKHQNGFEPFQRGWLEF